jgi:hypothetical protein
VKPLTQEATTIVKKKDAERALQDLVEAAQAADEPLLDPEDYG